MWRRWRRRVSTLLLATALTAGLIWADRHGAFGRRDRADMLVYHEQIFRCVKVVDGDTLDVDQPDGKYSGTRIRLWGVDTPETVRPNRPVDHFGPEASALTRGLCLGEPLRLELLPHATRDRHGRLLAYVYLPDGRMLNRVLLETGHAFADPRFEHRFVRDFAARMQQARENHLGLWAHATPADLPYYLPGSSRE
jgi:micrococcal nuclease